MAREIKQKQSPKNIWRTAFLAAYRDSGNVRLSAAAAGIGRRTVQAAMARDPRFAAQVEEAKQDAIDILDARAREGATVGFEEAIFFQGEKIATVRKVHPGLLMFLLKSLRREVYGDRQEVVQTGKDGGPQEHVVVHSVDTDLMTTEELEVMLRVARRVEGKVEEE